MYSQQLVCVWCFHRFQTASEEEKPWCLAAPYLLLAWYYYRISVLEYREMDMFTNAKLTPANPYLAYDYDALRYQQSSDILADFDKSLVKHRNFTRTDTGYFAGPLYSGDYGNVPVYVFNDYDNERTPLWRNPSHGIYLPNSKEYWKANNYPIEADAWIANGENYSYPFYPRA